MYRRIVVPVHGRRQDADAIELATAVAERSGATELTLVYVVEVPQELALDTDLPGEVERGETVLERTQNLARTTGDRRWKRVVTELLQARSAAAAIVDEAIERGADAVILAVANRRHFGTISQGETVPYILKNAPCDVVLVRGASENGMNS